MQALSKVIICRQDPPFLYLIFWKNLEGFRVAEERRIWGFHYLSGLQKSSKKMVPRGCQMKRIREFFLHKKFPLCRLPRPNGLFGSDTIYSGLEMGRTHFVVFFLYKRVLFC